MCYFTIISAHLISTETANYPENQIGRSGVQVKKENETFTVVCSHSLQNLEFGDFTLLFLTGRQRNVTKCKMHVQSNNKKQYKT